MEGLRNLRELGGAARLASRCGTRDNEKRRYRSGAADQPIFELAEATPAGVNARR